MDPDPGLLSNPDPDPGKKTLIFSKAIPKFWEKFLFSTQKVHILFLFSTNQVGILLNRELLFGTVSFLKISENHEKFVENLDSYSSISLPGSGSRFRIRIQPGNLNPDPPGSGSATLYISCRTYTVRNITGVPYPTCRRCRLLDILDSGRYLGTYRTDTVPS